MTKPLEIIYQNFQVKLDQIEKLFANMPCDLILVAKFKTLKDNFESQSLEILGDYFIATDIAVKCQCVEKFMQIIIAQNYISQMDDIIQSIKQFILSNKIELSSQIQLMFKVYSNTPIDTNVETEDYSKCTKCPAGRMILYPNDSEMRCCSCSQVMTLRGMSFDDTLHTNSEGTITKRGAYETSRHFRFHLDRILATKNPNIPDAKWAKIYEWIKTNNIDFVKQLSCKDFRRCLKDIKETQYNEYIPFIRQKITGIGPARLFHHEFNQLRIMFDKADMAFKNICEGERANLKYYPYFIFKIIELILDKPEDTDRLNSIVECIHFQQSKTLIMNDKLWCQMCEIVPEFKGKFRKTDKNLL